MGIKEEYRKETGGKWTTSRCESVSPSKEYVEWLEKKLINARKGINSLAAVVDRLVKEVGEEK